MADNSFDVSGGSNQILPNAQEANQYFYGTAVTTRMAADFENLRREILKEFTQ